MDPDPGTNFSKSRSIHRFFIFLPRFASQLVKHFRFCFQVAAKKQTEIYSQVEHELNDATGFVSDMLVETCSLFFYALPVFLVELNNFLRASKRLDPMIYKEKMFVHLYDPYSIPHPPDTGA